MSEMKNIIASNIIYLRKKEKLTQAELAEKLNYSDKAISKWERGESIPDIETLKSIAQMFGVTVDYLLTENAQDCLDQFKPVNQNKPNQLIITLLAVCMVWLAATIIFVYAKIFLSALIWQAFIWAIPASFLVLAIFNRMWGRRILNLYIDSAFVWTLLTAIYIQCLSYNIWLIFLIGVPLQILIILWATMKPRKNKKL